MKTFYLIATVLAAVVVSAAPVEQSRYLQNSYGKKTLFIKAEAKTFDGDEQAASKQARTQNGTAAHAGEVYYRTGVRKPAFRYVSTGRIVVRFAPGVDPETFAAANGLEYRRSFGIGKRSAVFINKSNADDIAKSNALLQQQSVESAEPDWVMPVKVY
ncbi:hypothetical protein WCX18_08805 [Sulfurimonas sp. HSL1-2]|uniref:hypothetical protein n=1 Tax=Thiomicrolovo zhangzhouensis TaxID=3131933 RepID=UPI0031F7F74C